MFVIYNPELDKYLEFDNLYCTDDEGEAEEVLALTKEIAQELGATNLDMLIVKEVNDQP